MKAFWILYSTLMDRPLILVYQKFILKTYHSRSHLKERRTIPRPANNLTLGREVVVPHQYFTAKLVNYLGCRDLEAEVEGTIIISIPINLLFR